jgi:hypothetical protein
MCSRLLIALLLLALSGCATTRGVAPLTVVDPPPGNLLVPCPPLPLLPEERPLLMGEDAEDDVLVSLQYGECAARHAALVRWWRAADQQLREAVKRLREE